MSRRPFLRDLVILGSLVWLGCSCAPLVGTAGAPHLHEQRVARRTTRSLPSQLKAELLLRSQAARRLVEQHRKGTSTHDMSAALSDNDPPNRDRDETLRVAGKSGACAAVAIAAQLAVTALHCALELCEGSASSVAGWPTGCAIGYELANGSTGIATVVATSESDLVALLDLHQPQPKFGSLMCDDPRAHDPVYTVGHPGGRKWSVTYGRLTSDPIAVEWQQGESTRVLVAEIPTKRGSSGGGLFDASDHVVGIVVARWSPWTNDFGKAAFIQANRVFSMVGKYCLNQDSNVCVGLRCASRYWTPSSPDY